MKKYLIIGGYGIFGGRVIELLEDQRSLTLIVAGRSMEKAEAFCEARGATKAKLVPAQFDRNGDLSTQLTEAKPDIVIDASGPFQDYGRDAYKLIEACIAQKINYLDLADGAEFVEGVNAYDKAARKAGVFILSGVSSFPVLTALVVKELSSNIKTINSIQGGIAPSPFAGVGKNVIHAIASYAGQPIAIKKDGAFTTGYPFTESLRYTVAPPGHIPLKNTLFSLVDVPDLKVLPQIWPETKTVWMGAGPVPEILHRALIGFSWLVRWKILPSLTPIVKLIQFVMNTVRWGEHRGGMFVEIKGQDSKGKNIRKSWHLLAEGKDGPLIPCMAIQAIIYKVLKGQKIPAGARTPVDDLKLKDYNALFKERTIYTGFRNDEPTLAKHLYEEVLGNSWKKLPPKIRNMHKLNGTKEVSGRANITRGCNFFSRFIASIIGFPKAAKDVPVSVNFKIENGREIWTRTFAEKAFTSHQYKGKGKSEHLIVERFGPLEFSMALVPEGSKRLRLVLRNWCFIGIPLPMWFCPRSDSYEYIKDGRFNFNVEISHPLIGKIIHYEGWLE